MRRILVLVGLILALSFFGAVKILNPIGPSIVPIVGILEGKIVGDVDIDVKFWKSADEVIASIKRKDVDIVVIPVSMGASLYNKGLGLKIAAVTMWKAFYLVSSERISSVEDLKGERVYMPHFKGTTVDVILRYMFEKLGMDPDKELDLVYAPPQEIVALMRAKKAKIAALPEPFATIASKVPGFDITLDLQREWARFTGLPPRIPITGVFVLNDSWEVEKALILMEISLKWALENTEKACELTTKYLKRFKVPILMEAFKRSDYEFVYMYGSDRYKRVVLEYLKTIRNVYPKAMPRVPDEDFFWKP